MELLPRFGGRGVGLAVVLKAMQVLAPANGLATLIAAPLEMPLREGSDPVRWRGAMRMDQFESDAPYARERLGRTGSG